MDFNTSVLGMGNNMRPFRVNERKVKNLRSAFADPPDHKWDKGYVYDRMPIHRELGELCKRVDIKNRFRVELHPLGDCRIICSGGEELRIINEIGIKHPDANFYTAVVQYHLGSNLMKNAGYFIVASPRIYRYKTLREAGYKYSRCAMKSSDSNRTFTAVNKLLPIKDRELLLAITKDSNNKVEELLEADRRELKGIAETTFRWVGSEGIRLELIRLLTASKEGVVAPYVDGSSSDTKGPIEAYEEYLEKKAELEESVEHNTGQVPIHIIRTFTGDALYCRYHSDIDETTEDMYAPILLNAHPSKPADDWQVYQQIEHLPETLYSKIMTLNIASDNTTGRDYRLRGVGMMFASDNVVKEHYVIFVKEDEEVFSV